MKARTTRPLASLLGSMALLPVLAGCSGDAPPLTKAEQKDFQGGPMPEEARKIMQQKLQEAQRNRQQNTPADLGPR